MIPWSKDQPQAFAGLHNKGNRLLLIFDEASEIEDIILWKPPKCLSPTVTLNSSGSFMATPHATQAASRVLRRRRPIPEFGHTTAIDSAKSRSLTRTHFAYRHLWRRLRLRPHPHPRPIPRQGLMEFFLVSDIDGAMSPDREVFVRCLHKTSGSRG